MGLLRWVREGNDCGKCRCYWWEQGYEDCDEGCYLERFEKGMYGRCYLPRIVRWYLLRRHDVLDDYHLDGMEEYFEEMADMDLRAENAIREKLGDHQCICYRRTDGTVHEMNQDSQIYEMAHCVRSAIQKYQDERQPNGLKAKWKDLLKETAVELWWKLRIFLTI